MVLLQSPALLRAMVSFGRGLWRGGGRATAPHDVELPQFVTQQVAERRATHGASQGGQQEVLARTRRRRQAEEVI